MVMKRLTIALDILQEEDRCFHGTFLTTLETLMHKTLQLKDGLDILIDLPEAIVVVRNKHRYMMGKNIVKLNNF